MSASVRLIFDLVALSIAMTLLAMALSDLELFNQRFGVGILTHHSITLLKNPRSS